MKAFRQAHPQVHIVLQVAGSDQLEAGIIRGEIDVGLLDLPENRQPRGVAWHYSSSDRLVAVVSDKHLLAHHHEIQLSEPATETFADFPTGTPARDESDFAFTAAGIHREVAFESMATDLTIELIRRNLAVTLLPSRYVPRHVGLVSLKIADGPFRAEYIVWSDFSPATHAFLEIIRQAEREQLLSTNPAVESNS